MIALCFITARTKEHFLPFVFYVSLNSVLLLQTQEGRAGEAHVSAAGEQTGADGAAGGTHEAAKGEMVTCFQKI